MDIYETIASKVEDRNAKNYRMIAHYDDELNKYSTFVRELYISLEEKDDETAVEVKKMIEDFLWNVVGYKYSDEDNVEIISAGDKPELKCEDYRYKAVKHFIRSMEDYV